MHKNSNKLKGIHTPNAVLFCKGLFDARLLKTAALDPDTGCIGSSYLTEGVKRFHSYSADQLKLLTNDVKSVRAEASDLVTEYHLIGKRMADVPAITAVSDVNRLRQHRRAAARRSSAVERRSEILHRLTEIDTKIRSRELQTLEELESAAGALQSKFAAYGRGMLLSVQPGQLPALSYAEALDLYHRANEAGDARMKAILEEVYHDA